jgi:hypothetical protein
MQSITGRINPHAFPLSKQFLCDLLAEFDKNKSFCSRLSEAEVIQKCRRFVESLALSDVELSGQQKETLGFIVFCDATWNSSEIQIKHGSATASFLRCVQKKLVGENYNEIHRSIFIILIFSKQLSLLSVKEIFITLTQSDWKHLRVISKVFQYFFESYLAHGVYAPAIFEKIIKINGEYAGSIFANLVTLFGSLSSRINLKKSFDLLMDADEKYADFIAEGLALLSRFYLLDGAQTQANFNLLVQSRGLCAESIAMGLVCLAKANLLAIYQAQENFNLLAQGGGKYASSIAEGLFTLTTYRYLLIDEHAQIYRDALTQGGGQYAKSIAVSLVRLSRSTRLLAGDHAQIYCDALTQSSGQYAESIAEGLQILFCAGLLTADNAQANRDVLVQSGGRYADPITRVLGCLSNMGVLAGNQGQANFNLLMRGDGKYAAHIVRALVRLSCAGILSDDQAQEKFNLLMQSGSRCVEGITICLEFFIPDYPSPDASIDFQSEFQHIISSFKAVTYEGGSPEFLTSVINKIKECGQLTPYTYQWLVPGSCAFGDMRLLRGFAAPNDEFVEDKNAFFQILEVLGLSPDKMSYVYQKNKNPQSMLNQIISLQALVSTSVDELSSLVCHLVSMVPSGHEHLLELCHSHLCHSEPGKRADVLVELIQLVSSYLDVKDVKNDSLANEVIYKLSQQSLFERGFFKTPSVIVDYCQVVNYCKRTAAPGS